MVDIYELFEFGLFYILLRQLRRSPYITTVTKMATPESNEVYRRIIWHTGVDSRPTPPTNLLSTSSFMHEIICRQCRRHQLPDLVESLPPTADANIPRSGAIEIPRTGIRRSHSISYSPEYFEIGQELRRMADDFRPTYRLTPPPRTSILNTGRSRSLSFLQQLPGFGSTGRRRNSTNE